jgi:hypothetical protein
MWDDVLDGEADDAGFGVHVEENGRGCDRVRSAEACETAAPASRRSPSWGVVPVVGAALILAAAPRGVLGSRKEVCPFGS